MVVSTPLYNIYEYSNILLSLKVLPIIWEDPAVEFVLLVKPTDQNVEHPKILERIMYALIHTILIFNPVYILIHTSGHTL